MEIVLKDSIFRDVSRLDDAYFSFMQANRTDMSSAIETRSSKFSFNFIKDEAYCPEDQTTFKWHSGDGETIGESSFAFAARASLTSMDSFANFTTATSEMEGEGEIPEIDFAKLGRASLTNEEWLREGGLRPSEDDTDEGTANRVPASRGTAHLSSSLPFGR